MLYVCRNRMLRQVDPGTAPEPVTATLALVGNGRCSPTLSVTRAQCWFHPGSHAGK